MSFADRTSPVRALGLTLAVISASLLLLGGRAFDLTRYLSVVTTGAPAPKVCSFRAATGYPCMGCYGTRAFEDAARGRFVAAARKNPLGAYAGLSAWLLAFVGTFTAFTGWRRPLMATLSTLIAGAPIVFVVRAVFWWMSLPPGALR
jgi:hypothetical protein